jgi:hypothetical protein
MQVSRIRNSQVSGGVAFALALALSLVVTIAVRPSAGAAADCTTGN